MKKMLLPVVLVGLCGMAGCLPTTINPLYTDKDLVFDPTLVGVWSDKDDSKETWTFEKAGDKSYKFVYVESDGEVGQFEARLLKIGDARFLDFFPDESGITEMNRSGFYKIHLLRTHSFLRVLQIEPTLLMTPMDLKWMRQFLAKNPQAIRHEIIGDGDDAQIVLTASTIELQRFVLTHLKTEGAFGDRIDLKRRPSDSKSQK